jgi:ribosome maturation factor RimP
MTDLRENIRALLLPITEAAGVFIVDVVVRNERGGKLVQAFVDTDKGITVDECAEISRELGRCIEQENVIQTSYRLEVSSPGADKPVRLLRQYPRNVGRRFKVMLQGSEPSKPFIGTLKAVHGDQLEFETDSGETIAIDFSKITESKVELPW